MLQKWTSTVINKGSISITATALRTGANGLRVNLLSNNINVSVYALRTIGPQVTLIMGIGFRADALPTVGKPFEIMHTWDAGTLQGKVRLNSDGTLSVCRGATVVQTSTLSILANTYYYIEFKHTVDPAAGTLEVRVNGTVWATFAGNTRQTANSSANQIGIGHATAFTTDIGTWNLDFDDLYVLDGTGAAPNNDYWGDTQIQALVPTGAGFYTGLATLVGAATHWQATSEIPPNEDTSYVEDTVVGNKDSFVHAALAGIVSATINGIQVMTRARNSDAGAGNFQRVYRNAAVDNLGALTALGAAYLYYQELLALDPITAAAWTVARINSGEFGFEVD